MECPQRASARTDDVEVGKARGRLGWPGTGCQGAGPGSAGHEHGPAVPVEQDPGSEGAGEYCGHFASFADWVAGTGRRVIGCHGGR